MDLYDYIRKAEEFNGSGQKPILAESIAPNEPGKTNFALGLIKRLSEAEPAKSEPVRLAAMPVSN